MLNDALNYNEDSKQHITNKFRDLKKNPSTACNTRDISDSNPNKHFKPVNNIENGKIREIISSERPEAQIECSQATKIQHERKQPFLEEKEAQRQESLKRRTCQICNAIFSIPKDLTNHIRAKHTHEKPHTCEICGERFAVQSAYALHKRRHLGIKPHLCNVCGMTFLRGTDLKTHMYKHNEDKHIQCDSCPNRYHSPLSLRKHKLIAHTDPRRWKHECETCGKKCVSTTTLALHMKRHNGDRSFKCPTCQKGFYTKQSMEVHTRTHSDFAEFNCHVCPKGYRSNEALQRHLFKVHNVGEEKRRAAPKFFCPVCREGFVQNGRYERHVRMHETGEEEFPFKCYVCSKKYKDGNFYANHMKTKHKANVAN